MPRIRLALGYLAIVLVVLRPPWSNAAIAAGVEPCDTVPFALAWAIGWGLSRLDAGGAGWWDAPIFAPTHGAFALSEPMPLLAIAAWPMHALGVPLGASVTVVLVATLVANGLMMRRWLLRLRCGAPLAIVGGAIATMLPFVHGELGVLPLVAIWPLLWMFTATGELLDARNGARVRRAAIELGLATVAGFACCAQLTLLTALVLVPAGLCRLERRHLGARMVGALALAIAIGAAGVLPLALPQRDVLDALGLHRSDRSQHRGAVRPIQLARVPWRGLVPLPSYWIAKRADARSLDPGPLRVITAAGGVGLGLLRRRRRREVAMLLAIALVSVALAFGPRLAILGWQPSEALAELVPGYGRIRALFRVLVLGQLAIVALAMIAVRLVQVRLRARRRRSWPVALLAVLLLVELTPPPPRWTELPRDDAAWVQWLRAHAEPGATIAWIPFAPSGEVCDHEDTARAMVLGLTHGHPMVNGYSSYFPPQHDRLSTAARTLPDHRGIEALRDVGVRYLVAHGDDPLDTSDASQALGIAMAFRDDDDAIVIWSIEP